MSTLPPTDLYLYDSESSDDDDETDRDQRLLSARPTKGWPCFLFTQDLPTEANGRISPRSLRVARSWRIAFAPSTNPDLNSLISGIEDKLPSLARNSVQGTSHIDDAIYNPKHSRKEGLAKCLWDAMSEAVKDKVTRPDKEAILARILARDEVLKFKARQDTSDTMDEENEGSLAPAHPSYQMSTEVDLVQKDDDLSGSPQEDLYSLPAVVVLPKDVFNQVTDPESPQSGVPFDYTASRLEYYDVELSMGWCLVDRPASR